MPTKAIPFVKVDLVLGLDSLPTRYDLSSFFCICIVYFIPIIKQVLKISIETHGTKKGIRFTHKR